MGAKVLARKLRQLPFGQQSRKERTQIIPQHSIFKKVPVFPFYILRRQYLDRVGGMKENENGNSRLRKTQSDGYKST